MAHKSKGLYVLECSCTSSAPIYIAFGAATYLSPVTNNCLLEFESNVVSFARMCTQIQEDFLPLM